MHLIILILSITGLGVSLYLNYEYKRKRPPVCVIGNSCVKVWSSPYSKILGISNALYGIIFYSTVAVVELTLFLGGSSFFMSIGEYLFLIAGSAMSIYFVFLQCRVIKAWCFWCTLSAIIVWVMLAIRLLF